MSQRAVEQLLGKLLTDFEFRREFYDDPAVACRRQALDLTGVELDAVRKVRQADIANLADRLDRRIVRAALGGTSYWGQWASQGPGARDPRTGSMWRR
jgi:hypothetical protein